MVYITFFIKYEKERKETKEKERKKERKHYLYIKKKLIIYIINIILVKQSYLINFHCNSFYELEIYAS